DQLDQMLADGIPFPARKRVVFVCPVGELSARYAALLRRADRPAASLAGGITAWRDAGHPLER
ncbi:MAG: rhodanese-like domain-containing protein, partial [Streptomycetaceae bacterium]|nr:rhodanese-like domain-containing protein [Streptomycetaceae bacterium]